MPRRARKDLDKIQDRRAEVVRLRGQGKTWDEIARLTGYSNGSAVSKAWKAAIQQHPDQSVDEVRRQEKTRLEQIDSVFSQVISSPPIRTTSIGRTQWDPRTCTCDVKGATNRDHAPDCQVEPVLDVHAVIQAATGRIKAGESLRRLVGADAPATSAVTVTDNSTRIIADVKQWYVEHPGYQRTPGSTVPPGIEVRGPAAVHAWEANQQYHQQQQQQRNKEITQ